MAEDHTDSGIEAEPASQARGGSGDELLDAVIAKFAGCGWEMGRDQSVAVVPPGQLVDVVEWLKSVHGFRMCVDVTAVDYLDHSDRSMGTYAGQRERFEVVVNLLDLDTPRRLRLRVPVNEDEPLCPTLAFVYPSADAQEREVYDMFGILFAGHPDLTRILMPDDWEGHPLRKDYPSAQIPVTFKEDHKRPEDVLGVAVRTVPDTGRPAGAEALEGGREDS